MKYDIVAPIVIPHLSWRGSICSAFYQTGSIGVASRVRHGDHVPLQYFPDFKFPWARKKDDDSTVATPGSAILDNIMSTSDSRHFPAAKRNREVISKELCTWLEKDAGDNNVLDIASGTGCHAEAFAKALPAWTFQPTEVSRAVPSIASFGLLFR